MLPGPMAWKPYASSSRLIIPRPSMTSASRTRWSQSNASFCFLSFSGEVEATGRMKKSKSSQPKARAIAHRVSMLEGWPASTRWIVRTVSPESSSSVSCGHSMMPRINFMAMPTSAGVSSLVSVSVVVSHLLVNDHKSNGGVKRGPRQQPDSDPTTSHIPGNLTGLLNGLPISLPTGLPRSLRGRVAAPVRLPKPFAAEPLWHR